MLKTGLKSLLALFLVFTALRCIDPYIPQLGVYKPVLVVEGLITNDNSSCSVKLSHSVQYRDSVSGKVTDANVFITDESGQVAHLSHTGNGEYRTDSLTFRGEIGKKYQLHIITSDGNEYASDSCTMYPVPGIDTIHYVKDSKLVNTQSSAKEGISVLLDVSQSTEERYFLRWGFDETWEFRIPYPTRYQYINDSTINLLPPSQVKEFCWKNSNSTDIMTGVSLSGSNSSLSNVPVTFIAPELSDRLAIKYSIEVIQYSISQREFDYWNKVKDLSETNGDIFGSQPYPVLSNVRNINDPEEQVLGYFEVSAVARKRIFISSEDIAGFHLPFYITPCKRYAKSPSDFPLTSPFAPPTTFNDIYKIFTTSKGYVFVEPVYNPDNGDLQKLVFTSPECANCGLTGTTSKPDFWTDK